LVIENTDDNSVKEMRWNGKEFVGLRLPPSKFIKARNSLQRCALDMLNNPEITICVLMGCPGSGKTKLCVSMAVYSVKEKGWQSQICFVREPWGEGKTEGYLKGTFEEKNAIWELPIIQQFDGNEFEVDRLKQQGMIEFNIPTYMKGTTYHGIILVDEAEDLSEKQLRLIGTRCGDEGRLFFDGDIKQSLIDHSNNNPLMKMCNYFKGNEMFACIMLDEDVRSKTSQLFANMYFD
jgi:PhoH-like ATPase